MKLWKKIAIGAGCVIALLVAFDLTGRLLFPEKWAELDQKVEADRKARAEQKQQAEAEKAKTSRPSAAMYAGGLVAMDLAKNGAIKPGSDKVEALARKAATERGVSDPAERRKYVDEWQRGFWVGWKSATR
jgi:hypothetical protein